MSEKNKQSIKVGCCGFATSQKKYFEDFDAIEIQKTFYQPPQLSTAERWRNSAPQPFEFTLKAWQLITHPASSPTYKRLRKQLTDQQKDNVGFFQDTQIVFEAWEQTVEIAKILACKIVVFQCPKRFTPTKDHIQNLRNFFNRIDRSDIICCWEPRGDWSDRTISELCNELNLIHCVDPFSKTSVTKCIRYYRLHGISGYRYQYNESDFKRLLEFTDPNAVNYIMFNNINMLQDARRFKEKVADIE